jgi:hypothetical protein
VVQKYRNLEGNRWSESTADILFSFPAFPPDVSLVDRLARLFREPAAADAEPPTDAYRGDGGGEDAARSDAVAVVVQDPPAGVRRYELTVRGDTPVETVDPGLLTRLFETFDEGRGVVRARAVDVDGHGTDIEAATPLFTVRFVDPVVTETVSLDGTLTGHDEEPVPWSRVRLTPVE